MADRPVPAPPDVVVVGAGTAGCVAAARLAERGARVTLLETGRRHDRMPLWSLRGAFDPSRSRGDQVDLGAGRRVATRRGIGVGGSSSINGGYFLFPTPEDLRRWHRVGGDPWRPARLRELLDRAAAASSGGDGLPLEADRTDEPVSAAFAAACEQSGIAEVADLDRPPRAHGLEGHASSGPGVVGPVTFTSRAGRRIDVADVFVEARGAAPVRLVQAAAVRRVLFTGGRAVGVEVEGGEGASVVRCEHVVLCAGALGTAEILVRSGVGPAHVLRGAGVDVVAELAGVGTQLATHPYVDLPYLPTPAARRVERAPFLQLAAELDDPAWGGVVEVMATRRPYGVVTGTDPDDDLLHLRVTAMASRRRWAMRHTWAVEGGALDRVGSAEVGPTAGPEGDEAADLDALAVAVTRTCELAASDRFAPVVSSWFGPGPDVDAAALRRWVREHLQLSFHWCASAPVGAADDPAAVVDGRLAVRGVEGLWVGDLSALPDAPSRGPAASAVMLGALAGDVVG